MYSSITGEKSKALGFFDSSVDIDVSNGPCFKLRCEFDAHRLLRLQESRAEIKQDNLKSFLVFDGR